MDDAANTAWHIDLKELTASKLLALASGIREKGIIKRINQWDVESLVVKSVRHGRVKLEHLNLGLAAKLTPLIASSSDPEITIDS